MKKLFIILSLFMVIFTSYAASAAPGSTNEIIEKSKNTITIFHTSDLNGKISGNENSDTIDFSYIGALKKAMPDSILLDTGNYIYGSPIVEKNKGEDMINYMNLAGYDFAGVGSFEFEYGAERLLELQSLAKFYMVSSNITQNGKYLFEDNMIVEVDGINVGFFSLTSENTSKIIESHKISEISFSEIYSAARQSIKNLTSQKVDIIVALTCLGEKSSSEFASLVNGIDIIIDGGNENPIFNNNNVGKLVNNTLIVSSGANNTRLGRVDIILDENKKITNFSANLFSSYEMKSLQKNTEISKPLDALQKEVDKLYNEPISASKYLLSNEAAPGIQTNSAPLGNFIADVYRKQLNADISIVSAYEIKSDINEGLITRYNIQQLLDSSSKLQVKNISPKTLRLALEGAVSSIVIKENGAIDYELSKSVKFPHISGFKFHYNPNNDIGHKVISIVLDDGKSLNLEDTQEFISLAATTYLMNGGEGYGALTSINSDFFDQYEDTNTVFINYLLSGGEITSDDTQRAILTDRKESNARILILSATIVFSLIIVLIIFSALIAKIK